MARQGYITVVNTTLRDDGMPVYSEIRPEDLKLAEGMGYRLWNGGGQPNEAKAYQPQQRQSTDFTKLQERIDIMLELGFKPDLKEVGKLSDAEFAQQVELMKQELIGETESQQAGTQEPPTRGRKKNALQGAQD